MGQHLHRWPFCDFCGVGVKPKKKPKMRKPVARKPTQVHKPKNKKLRQDKVFLCQKCKGCGRVRAKRGHITETCENCGGTGYIIQED